MSPGMGLAVQTNEEEEVLESEYQKGVKRLCEKGITKVPRKYILPVLDRPNTGEEDGSTNLKLPIIDFAQLQGSNRIDVLKSLSKACEEYGFFQVSLFSHMFDRTTYYMNFLLLIFNFSSCCSWTMQLVNHGIASEAILNIIEAGREFFELPFEERSKYMSKDMRSAVRYGTSFNQTTDAVFCWRDFLKLSCHPLSDVLPSWPSSPSGLR